MRIVYNGSPDLPDLFYTPWQQIGSLPSNDILAQAGAPDQLPVIAADDRIAEVLSAFAHGSIVWANWEPASGSWKYLNYGLHPVEAAALKLELVTAIKRVRPDLQLLLYICPETTGNITKDAAKYLPQVAAREVAYLPASAHMSYCGISGYWKGDHNDETFAIWERRQEMSIALARCVHNKEPLAFVWDNNGHGWKPPMTGANFRRILKFYAARDVDVIYWSPWWPANRGPIANSTQFQLWQFAMGML